MRICFYTETALPKIGGQELVIDALARQFLELGHEPLVLAPPPKRRRVKAHDAQLPYPVIRHPRFVSTRYLLEWYATFLRRAASPSVRYLALPFNLSLWVPGRAVQGRTWRADRHYQSWRRRERAGAPAGQARFPGAMMRSLAAADALVSISKFTTAGYQRLCPTASNIEAIPNGVHLAPFASAAPRPASLDARVRPREYVLFLGRLNRRKGVDVLIDALARLPADLKTALVIAGDGDERATLETQCAELGLTNRVHFLGAVGGAAKVWLLQNARFVVIPSRGWEAFPLVVLESFAAGKPVLGTRIPGLEDLVEPERTGLLVPAESPDALAEAMAVLLRDADAVREYGRHARRVVQEFDWRSIAEQHLRLYRRLWSSALVDAFTPAGHSSSGGNQPSASPASFVGQGVDER